MKKKYIFKFIATLSFILCLHLQTTAQVRIVEVDPATERVKLHNYGGSTVDVSNYWFCSLFVYGQLNGMTIISGALNLAPNANVELTSSVALNNTAADLGLYNTNSFGSSTAMQDFTQWGSGGNGRENVAVNKGIWVAGTFISVPAPYEYTGNGGQNGSQFWDTLLGIEEFSSNQFRILQNPAKSRLELSLPRVSGALTLDVFDVLGKRIFSKELSGVAPSIDISKWNAGVYLVRLSADNVTETKRFIKQ
jgi:hypothetical protein